MAPVAEKRCKICGAADGPWTVEDSYPKWLWKRIRERFRSLPAELLPPDWEQGRRTLLKYVCEPCQKHLASTFETPASGLLKTLMDGSAIDLTPGEQGVVSGWVFKTAMVLTLTHPAAEPDVREEARLQLLRAMKLGTPPPGATVRIAYIAESLQPSLGSFLPAGWPDRTRYGLNSVIAVPGLLCETLTSSDPFLLEFALGTKQDDRFIRIWPTWENAPWPPAKTVGLYDPMTLREEWNHPPKNLGGNFPPLRLPAPLPPPGDA